MTMHFNVGEAKAQLSKLIDAAVRGEDVVIDHAGKPRVKLVPVLEAVNEAHARVVEKRKAFIASIKGTFEGYDLSVEALKAERQYSPWRRAAYGMDDPD